MTISNHYASGYLSNTFFGTQPKVPSGIAIALTHTPVTVGQAGDTIDEVQTVVSGQNTGYKRCYMGTPEQSGAHMWKFHVYDIEDASGNLVAANVIDSGTLVNKSTISFGRCLKEWGELSSVAVMDSPVPNEGSVIAFADLVDEEGNPVVRNAIQGDNFVFNPESLQISYN